MYMYNVVTYFFVINLLPGVGGAMSLVFAIHDEVAVREIIFYLSSFGCCFEGRVVGLESHRGFRSVHQETLQNTCND